MLQKKLPNSNGNFFCSLKSISGVESRYLNEIQTALVPFSEEKTYVTF